MVEIVNMAKNEKEVSNFLEYILIKRDFIILNYSKWYRCRCLYRYR